MKYIDVVINQQDKSYYIVESDTKPIKHDSALETLKKIELIVRENFKYDSNHKDSYSNFKPEKLIICLREKSWQIRKGYLDKLRTTNWLTRNVFGKKKKIDRVYGKIGESLSVDAFKEIAKHLGVAGLRVLSQVNRQGKSYGTRDKIKYAQSLGYEGQSSVEAGKYLKHLFKEIELLAKRNVIPKKYLSYRKRIFGKKVDPEKTLQNLQKDLTGHYEIFGMLYNVEACNYNFQNLFQNFKKMICFSLKGKISKIDKDAEKTAEAVLILAAQVGDKEMCEFVWKFGVDINAKDYQGKTALTWAAYSGKTKTVESLIQHGAKLDLIDDYGQTPLFYAVFRAIRDRNFETIQLLLDQGADINVRDATGQTVLLYAQSMLTHRSQSTKEALIQFLKDKGAIG